MTTSLLDLNVLIALAWPSHVHHESAHRWFSEQRPGRWATCPLIQCGFVRLSSNASIIPEAVTPREALLVLQGMTAHPDHVFWPDELDLSRDGAIPLAALSGHRQVVDAYLVGLAAQKKGRLVTLDRRLKNAMHAGAFDAFVTLIGSD